MFLLDCPPFCFSCCPRESGLAPVPHDMKLGNGSMDKVEVIEIPSTSRNVVRNRSRTLTDKAIIATGDNNTLKAARLKRFAFIEKETENCTGNKNLSICIGDEDDDVIFIPPDEYTPNKKRQKLQENVVSSPSSKYSDLSVTFCRSADHFPHAREHCKSCKFVQSNVTTSTVSCNESMCEKCYCYVCDDLAQKCENWKIGVHPHCNAYAKNTFWEREREQLKREDSDRMASGQAGLTDVFALYTIEEQWNHVIRSLNSIHPLSDPSVVKCLDCTATSRLQEGDEIFRRRLDHLGKNKRYGEACNYILGTEITCAPSYAGIPLSLRACDKIEHRQTLTSYLIESGRVLEATFVCAFPYHMKLPDNIANEMAYYPHDTPKEMKWQVAGSPIKDLKFDKFKRMLTAIVSGDVPTPRTQAPSVPVAMNYVERKGQAISLILSATQVNCSLRTEACIEWYLNLLCEQNLKNKQYSDDIRRRAQEQAATIVKNAKIRLLKIPEVIGSSTILKAFVVELFIALAAELSKLGGYSSYPGYGYYVNPLPLKCLKVFSELGLHWACVSIFHCPTLREKIGADEVEFFKKSVLTKSGSDCTPRETMENDLNEVQDGGDSALQNGGLKTKRRRRHRPKRRRLSSLDGREQIP